MVVRQQAVVTKISVEWQEEVPGAPEGTFPDFIGISNWYISVPKNQNPNPVFNFLHSYFAGTSNVSWPRPGEASGGGVFVGNGE